MPDILLHICCAPCLTFTREEMDRMGLGFTGIWYNPNVHPYTEYKKRLETLRKYASSKPMEIIFRDEYEVRKWLEEALDTERSGKKRCEFCYRTRLELVAREARTNGFKRFSTTLLFSRHQDHDLLKSVASEVADAEGIEFFYHDFRSGHKRSREICKELDLYRQNYCGCILSEQERFLGK